MKVIEVPGDLGGRLRICYGMDSTVALVEIKGPLLASPEVLRELARALVLAAADIEGRWLDCAGLADGEFIRGVGGHEEPTDSR